VRPELDLVLWRGGMGEATARLSSPEAIAHLRGRIEGFPLFRPEEYVRLNDDLAGLEGTGHYAEYGVWESHRRFASEKTTAAVLGQLSGGVLPKPEVPDAGRLAQALAKLRGREVVLHCNRQGRWFTHALARDLADAFAAVGVQARVADETADRSPGPLRVFVSPQEFFTHGAGAEWATLETLSTSLMYATEPAESEQFRASVPYLLACAGVISPYPQVCALGGRAGVATLVHLPAGEDDDGTALPDHPIARALPRAAKAYDASSDVWSERPIDVSFFGTETAVRDEFFAGAAPFLAELSCVIHLTRWYGSPQTQQEGDSRAALTRYAGRRSKVVLNLAESELASLDWRRALMGGFARKALIVSTPCLPHPLFKPGVHYLEDSWRRLPKLIDWLLRSEDGARTAERVRHQAYAALLEHGGRMAAGGALASFVAEQAR